MLMVIYINMFVKLYQNLNNLLEVNKIYGVLV